MTDQEREAAFTEKALTIIDQALHVLVALERWLNAKAEGEQVMSAWNKKQTGGRA